MTSPTLPSASPVPSRTLLHTRQVACAGYQRSDGLFDIEATMQDITPFESPLLTRHLNPGDKIHEMRIVVTIDAELLIHDVHASTFWGPADECRDAAPAYAALKGMRIGRGFRKRVQELVGGVNGCTHLTELLGPLATTAMQTMYAVRRADGTTQRVLAGTDPMPKPTVIDTCRTYRSDGQAIKIIWPEHRRAR